MTFAEDADILLERAESGNISPRDALLELFSHPQVPLYPTASTPADKKVIIIWPLELRCRMQINASGERCIFATKDRAGNLRSHVNKKHGLESTKLSDRNKLHRYLTLSSQVMSKPTLKMLRHCIDSLLEREEESEPELPTTPRQTTRDKSTPLSDPPTYVPDFTPTHLSTSDLVLRPRRTRSQPITPAADEGADEAADGAAEGAAGGAAEGAAGGAAGERRSAAAAGGRRSAAAAGGRAAAGRSAAAAGSSAAGGRAAAGRSAAAAGSSAAGRSAAAAGSSAAGGEAEQRADEEPETEQEAGGAAAGGDEEEGSATIPTSSRRSTTPRKKRQKYC
ncbi:hypothetical protein EDC01DRAFT_626466 [Geopyxis carbonaria]|nr:hypothetical protein EDC01DRAFT_626466 [Geopyxis carbonaria]